MKSCNLFAAFFQRQSRCFKWRAATWRVSSWHLLTKVNILRKHPLYYRHGQKVIRRSLPITLFNCNIKLPGWKNSISAIFRRWQVNIIKKSQWNHPNFHLLYCMIKHRIQYRIRSIMYIPFKNFESKIDTSKKT